MLARSPNSLGATAATGPVDGGTILIAAVSARALVQAARRGGYRALALDFFGDRDTIDAVEYWAPLPGTLGEGVDRAAIRDALSELSVYACRADTAEQPEPGRAPILVLGSGFERLPDIVDELARHYRVAGCHGAAIRNVKDPVWLARTCSSLGIPHPEISAATPADAADWVVKSAGGAGGSHIFDASNDSPGPGQYFQQRVRGKSLSVLFVGDSERAHIVGYSRQWTSPAPHSPYRYGGAVLVRPPNNGVSAHINHWLTRLTVSAGLVGLCSADFIGTGNDLTLIEINPRPGATLDIFDTEQAPLLRAHIASCLGHPIELPRHVGSKASLIAYARDPIVSFPEIDWPDWASDRQANGTQLAAGDPICTIFGQGQTAMAAKRGAFQRLRQLEREWTT